MKPTTDQTRRILALDLETRRRLWELADGQGEWYSPEGDLFHAGCVTPMMLEHLLGSHFAFAPADSAVWMEVAATSLGQCQITWRRDFTGRIFYMIEVLHPSLFFHDPSPISCAPTALEARK